MLDCLYHMKEKDWKMNKVEKISRYVIIPAVVSLIVFVVVYKLWNCDLNVPIFYDYVDDFTHGVFYNRALKGQLNLWECDRMGFPYGNKMYAHPHLPFTAIYWSYILGIFGASYGLAMNSYYFLTFLFEVYAFIYVSKKIGVKYEWALAAGILFAFWQQHLTSGMKHATAVSYFSVPLLILLCYYTYTGGFRKDKKKYIELGICSFIIASADTFYAFFGCFFLFACIIVAFLKKNKESVIYGLICISSIIVFTGALLSPSIIYNLTHESSVVGRSAYGAFFWGLRLISLFAPKYVNHPLGFVQRISKINQLPTGVETYLGIIGISGFLILLICLFKEGDKDNKRGEILKFCSVLNIVALLVGLSGGFGYLVALLITDKVRVYYRIAIYIYCLSLLSIAVLLSYNQYANKMNTWCKWTLVLAMICFHLCDLQVWKQVPNYENINNRYNTDFQLVKSIEEDIGKSGKVLVLPYLDFPENLAESGVGNYNYSVILNILSDTLYSSTGHVTGTKESNLMKNKYSMEKTEQVLYWAAKDGFDGILIDTKALNNSDDKIQQFNNILGSPLTYKNNTIFFYNIQNKKNQLMDLSGYEGFLNFEEGFYVEEKNDTQWWRWSNQLSELTIEGEPGIYQLEFSCVGINGMQGELRIQGCGIDTVININGEYQLELDTRTGNKLSFESTITPINLEGAGRKLSFGLLNYTLMKGGKP